MYYLKAENSFDAAHFLAGYDGKCSNLHGHRWRVLAEIKGEQVDARGQTRGMVLDFGDLKKEVKRITDVFDHSLIYEEGSLKSKTVEALQEEGFCLNAVPFRPTAECFSQYFYKVLQKQGYAVHRVTVYETPNNCAAYEE